MLFVLCTARKTKVLPGTCQTHFDLEDFCSHVNVSLHSQVAHFIEGSSESTS